MADEAVKLQLLAEIEGRVLVELLGEEPGDVDINEETPRDRELAVPAPYDRLYWLYVAAMLYIMGGYTERYEACAALFNAAYRDFGKWLKRKGE
jgi:hypothetical protein